jgi:hypothetical protein
MTAQIKTFADYEVLTASDVNNYLMNQAVIKVLNTTERDALSTSVKQAYNTTNGDVYVRNSSNAWLTYNTAWQTFTPTWTSSGTSPSLGNGTLTGAYLLQGKSVIWRVHLTMGSTTTYGSGAWRWDTPVTTAGVLAGAGGGLGNGSLYDTSAAARRMRDVYHSSTTYVSLSDQDGNAVGGSTPFTWANGDTVAFQATAEVA